MSLLINNAIAATAEPMQASDGTFSMVMIAVIFVLFYFMLIRPQNKRAKEHRDLIAKLQKGDEVVTTGGLVAKIVSLDDQFIKASVAEGFDVMLQRQAITLLLPKGTLKTLS